MNTRVLSPVSLLRTSAAGILFAVATAALLMFAGRTEARGEGLLGGAAIGGEPLPTELALGLGLPQGGDLQHLDLLAQQAENSEAVLPSERPHIRGSADDEMATASSDVDVDGELFPRSRSVLPLLVSAGNGSGAPATAAATVVPMRPGAIQPVGVPLSRFRSSVLPVGTPPAERLFRSIR